MAGKDDGMWARFSPLAGRVLPREASQPLDKVWKKPAPTGEKGDKQALVEGIGIL